MTKNELKKMMEIGYRVFHTSVGETALVSIAHKIGDNCGLYGWNWTAYRLGSSNVIILIAYRNTVGESVPSNIIDWYNENRRECKSYQDTEDLQYRLVDKLNSL